MPFENLDIHDGVPIVLDPELIFTKIVARRRGGYCYELNSAFAALLVFFGYRVDMLGARVAKGNGVFGRPLAHLTLIVRAADRARPLLVDVGFGDAFTAPIPLIEDTPHRDRDRRVRLVMRKSEWHYQEDHGDGWQTRYAFTTQPRRLADFTEMNTWQQTSPESVFTTSTLCSMLRHDGRVTISGDRLITTTAGRRDERTLTMNEIEQTLVSQFGIIRTGE